MGKLRAECRDTKTRPVHGIGVIGNKTAVGDVEVFTDIAIWKVGEIKPFSPTFRRAFVSLSVRDGPGRGFQCALRFGRRA